MLPWITQALRTLSVRPARRADAAAINQLLDSSLHSHIHPDWRPAIDWIGRAVALVAETRTGLAGCIIAPADPPPAAWLRAVAVADGFPAGRVLPLLLSACLAQLARDGVATLAAMPAGPWLAPYLDDAGFAIVEQVETWAKPDLHIPRAGAADVTVRPAGRADIEKLAAIDAAAFAPRWRYSAETLALVWNRTGLFTMAARAGKAVGFQLSLAYGEIAHLARITVSPDAQQGGVGSRLLADLLTRCTSMGITMVSLNTQSDNHTSQQLYSAFGFRPVDSPIAVWERPV